VDWGENEDNVNDLVAKYSELKSSLTEEEVALIYSQLQAQFVEQGNDILEPANFAEYNKPVRTLDMFIPRENYVVTPIIMMLNILVFIVMVVNGVHFMDPDAETLYNWGGNFGIQTVQGEWWRLVSCMFLHAGVLHLLMNMYALISVGVFLEPLIGKARFVTAYFVTGAIAGMASIYTHPQIVSVGASGAVFGMYGVYVSLLTTNLISKEMRKAMLPSMGVYIGYNLIYGMKEGIDNAAHIGGLVSGFVVGYMFLLSLRKSDNAGLKYGSILAAVALTLVGVFTMPKDITGQQQAQQDMAKAYEQAIAEFVALEAEAIQAIDSPAATSEGVIAQLNKGVDNWKKSELIIAALDSFDMPDQAAMTLNRLARYASLRTEQYELMVKKLQQETEVYDAKLLELNKSIEAEVRALQAPSAEDAK
jgi:rhomboid protease GluP